ncbi:replication restart helicase PriA [Polaromonas jejuensis]|uniref:Replication restart protein PriA n=1 Tax=Polaromonas jejuensis TaxID=457502 RepID=A0ABW0QEN9_9BURK|nr:primosomal protein N' [Polaromonas jejuensis]
MSYWLQVVVATPAHSAIAGPLTYRSESPLAVGALVRVPLGRREVLGVVWDLLPDGGALQAENIRLVAGVLEGLAPLSATWRKLVSFTAGYYQRSLGEVALAALPPQLRELNAVQLTRRLKRPVVDTSRAQDTSDLIALSAQQERALAEFDADTRPALLFGATGSGKTEVYLRAAAKVLAQDPAAQVLVMVPEINLTPQLQARFEERFAHLGKERVVALHSGLTPAQRLKSWLAAHAGQARLVLGTRMAVLASLPHLRLLVVDEEHDPSYKQQEGARYSARDLAVYRAKLESADTDHPHGDCRVLLGSATPSLESWQATLTGRYQRLNMSERIGVPSAIDTEATQFSDGPPLGKLAPPGGSELHAVSERGGLPLSAGPPQGKLAPPGGREPHAVGERGGLPLVRRVDMNHQPKHCTIAPPLLDAIAQRVARGEQSLIFLNRRGYAPVLACHDCGWKSECPHCSAYRVFHKIDRTLRCHHCGFTERVPRACPSCGNIDIAPVGRGTERLEEHLAELLAGVRRPDGEAVRIARIDADTTRLKGALESQLASVHAGEVDVLVGTQMIAKGHDFRHITLVAAVNPDGALFSSDFRAPERLFSLLMQAGGRAGRDARHSQASEMWVQTFHPAHPLFEALKRHDYPVFAARELAERQAAGMSPFGYSALVRAEAKEQSVAQGFLNAAAAAAQLRQLPGHDAVTPYPAVPMTIQRVANIERAQMLVESPSRAALQRFLAAWQPLLFDTRRQAEFKSLVRWAIDVDPIAI